MKSIIFLILFTIHSFAAETPVLTIQKPIDLSQRVNHNRVQGASARAGDHVGNGGGLSESTLAFARLKLAEIIERCLSSTMCLSSIKAKEVAKKVLHNMKDELVVDGQLQYISGRSRPGFFFLDDNIRIAKTGSSTGDPIYINRDLIYDSKGEALSFEQAVALLFHEYGHHVDFHDHDYLDYLGSKIGIFISKKKSNIGSLYAEVSLPKTKNKIAQLDVLSLSEGREQLILSTKNKKIDLTASILHEVKRVVNQSCKNQVKACETFLGLQESYKANVFYFENAQFEKVQTAQVNRNFYYSDIQFDGYFYHDLNIASSRFYHLKGRFNIRLKFDYLEHNLYSLELKSSDLDDLFNVKFID